MYDRYWRDYLGHRALLLNKHPFVRDESIILDLSARPFERSLQMTLSLFDSLRGRSIYTGIMLLIIGGCFCILMPKVATAADDSLRVIVAEAEADWYEIQQQAEARGVNLERRSKLNPGWLQGEARALATLAAQKKAVEKALALLLPYEKIEENYEALEQELLLHAGQYSATSEVIFVYLRAPDLSDRRDKGSTKVRVQMFVEMDKLKSQLAAMGLYEETVPAADALLLFQVNVADVPFESTGCRMEFQNLFALNNINVLQPEGLEQALPEETPYNFSDIGWLTQLGEEFEADLVFVVECTGTIRKLQQLSTRDLLTCLMDSRCLIVDVVNDDIFDEEDISISMMDERATEAARKTCLQSCELLAERVVPRVKMKWSDRYWAGVDITVEIENMTYLLLEKMLRTLRDLTWVNSVQQETVVENHAVIEVNVRDDASGLAATIENLPNLPVKVKKVSPDRIILERIMEFNVEQKLSETGERE